jgi:NAD(P)-dependent dehydrogenase (short-subunit alcohol dehydrogenase family)
MTAPAGWPPRRGRWPSSTPPAGIRVNAVALGVIRTAPGDDAYASLAQQHPIAESVDVQYVVDGILFLESSDVHHREISTSTAAGVAGH